MADRTMFRDVSALVTDVGAHRVSEPAGRRMRTMRMLVSRSEDGDAQSRTETSAGSLSFQRD